ncbi:NADH dehydrogenase (ubiquinone) 1 alpha subcomplex 5 [Rhizoctonia solani]|uniref:NADH dehydrogenase (Ubiquinone) 1 alpha subcomplex 5 n=1 Tax=Rhizoctonia solani TaxID=456999 RepID=A0A8H8NTZ6_9AGAM|nr:NADH dehydrogenase (ubiquinone) 1 alpha subcomplex 5 [Rhizoctonia solani]QRW19310.1 NADH dehydrogenase (ubiquinone) 1 alpha subcomplex 5 [Rhizoctonia solani]
MLRFTRPLRQALKSTTGIYGVAVHPDPLPVLRKTYESTLSILSQMPSHASKGDATQVENTLGEGQIEEILMSAEDELSLAGKMLEWKPWEPLEVKPAPGQWDYVRD